MNAWSRTPRTPAQLEDRRAYIHAVFDAQTYRIQLEAIADLAEQLVVCAQPFLSLPSTGVCTSGHGTSRTSALMLQSGRLVCTRAQGLIRGQWDVWAMRRILRISFPI